MPDREESIDFDNTKNLFIEGDNLEVLKLLQKSYLGKIKMIYIDPPYNTGNDFIYPDNYAENLSTYLEYTGQVDGEGKKFATNTETDGRFHSKWMNMMYPRLFLAKNLLKEEGVIFISIDDHEVDNLRKICNEIFGEENYRNTIIVRRGVKNVQSQFETLTNLSSGHEYILLYSKRADFKFPKLSHELPETEAGKWDTFWRGTDRPTMRYELFGKTPEKGQWRWERERTSIAVKNYDSYLTNIKDKLSLDEYFWDHYTSTNEKLDFVRLNEDNVIQYYVPPRDYKLISDNWMDVSIKGNVIGFDTEKHVELLKRIFKWVLSDGEIVLDFFAGSASTAHAIYDLNKKDQGKRNYICVQLPEPINETDEAYKNGFKSISEMSKKRIKNVIESLKSAQQSSGDLFSEESAKCDLGFKAFNLQKSNFTIWDSSVEKKSDILQAALDLHVNHLSSSAQQENILFEILLKSGFELTTSIEKLEIEGKTVYSIADGELLICLEKGLTQELIKAIAERQPTRVICLDEGFQNNDQLKTNAVQIMKSKNVLSFRTV
jgi:adenine-specific DNA-methyltransferase